MNDVVIVFYVLTGTGCCFSVLAISATSFTISHRVAKIAPNWLPDKENLLKGI
jgi:hypothetical protein